MLEESTCLDDFQYVVDLNNFESLDEAELFCESLNGSLASIPNSKTLNFVSTFLEKANKNQDLDFFDVWIGLRINESITLTRRVVNITLFENIDGIQQDEGFGSEIGISPWAEGRPNNVDEVQEKCVA